jgi:Holliday junction resolvasome RuvABC endonuclease subunit
MKGLNIMSIDPSKRSIGIFIKTKLGDKILDTIKSKAKESEADIYIKINAALVILMKYHEIDLLFIEENSFSSSNFKSGNRTAQVMGEVIGIIKLAAYQAGIKKIIPVNNKLWKGVLKLPFVGLDKKKKAGKYTNLAIQCLKMKFANNDEVDAYCILLAMWQLWSGPAWTDAQIKMKNRLMEL